MKILIRCFLFSLFTAILIFSASSCDNKTPPVSETATEAVSEETSAAETPKADKTSKRTGFFEPLEAPMLFIDTRNGAPINSRENYVNAAVSLSNTKDDSKFGFDKLPAQIRGRGNATWNIMEKKSYRLRFDDNINLLGAGTGEDRVWVLLANHCDQSFMRNYTAFRLGNLFSGLEYSSSCSLVELYLNGKYDGVYMICEQVKVDKNRVDVNDKLNIPENGFLIELDRYAEGVENVDYFMSGGFAYTIKSSIQSNEQVKYVQNYINNVEEAIFGNDRQKIEDLVDMKSCIDMYILQEYMKNIDVGWSSFFMYIKENGGKLYFGPPWDFDLAAGNDYRLDDGSYRSIYVGNGEYHFTQEHRWYVKLMTYGWFQKLVRERWDIVKSYILDVIKEVGIVGNSYIGSCERNFKRWRIFGSRINQEPEKVMALDSYSEHLDYLIKWLNNRWEWIDNEWS